MSNAMPYIAAVITIVTFVTGGVILIVNGNIFWGALCIIGALSVQVVTKED